MILIGMADKSVINMPQTIVFQERLDDVFPDFFLAAAPAIDEAGAAIAAKQDAVTLTDIEKSNPVRYFLPGNRDKQTGKRDTEQAHAKKSVLPAALWPWYPS